MTRLTRQTIGDIDVDIIRDGGMVFPEDVFPALSADRIASLLNGFGAESIETGFNCMLIRRGDSTILIDAGCGSVMGEAAGKLPEALAEAGVAPGDVQTLVITHLHPDHISGALNDDGEAIFANAEMILAEAERRYWVDDGNFAGVDAGGLEWRSVALKMLDVYADRMTLIDTKAEIASGVSTIPLPGHTPGHFGIMVEQGRTALFFGSDLYHAEGLQLADASICAAFDLDPEAAIDTRRKTMDMLAAEKLLMSAGHMLAPPLGYLERTADGYAITRAG